jgi:molybdate transport system substrate-binding protein
MKFKLKVIVAVVASLICLPPLATGAELKLIGNYGNDLMTLIAPEFEKSTGHRIRWEQGLFQKFKTVIDQRGFDVIVATGETADYAESQKAVIGKLVSVSQVGIGISVKKGAPKPDISTVEAFKRSMLGAKSISYTSGSSAGKYLVNLMQRLGIAEQMKPKTKLLGGGGQNPRAVAAGEVELGLSIISDIVPIDGVDLLGPLPPEIQNYIVQRAGISAATKEPQAAMAFINFLKTANVQSALKARGYEPIN